MRRIVPATMLLSAALFTGAPVGADVLHVPGDHGTIQAAIDVAQAGDEIIVAPGTHAGPVDLLGKAITLRGTDPDDPAVVEATRIDGGGAGTVIVCSSGEGPQTIVDGLTITGGDGSSGGAGINGGGMYILGSLQPPPNAAPVIRRCLFRGNTAFGGGAMLIESAAPLVDRCRFVDNIAESPGGAVYCRFLGAPSFVDCLFENNHAQFRGGAMNCSTTDSTLVDCVFRGNTTDHESGAIHIKSFSDPIISGCTFESNVAATEPGGAIRVEGNCHPTIIACEFNDNSASAGGAVFINAGSGTSIGSTVFGCNAPNSIGGVYVDDGGNTFVADCFACEADATGNGVVDVDDLVAVIVDWGTDGVANNADVFPDGTVDVNDLITVIRRWGPCGG